MPEATSTTVSAGGQASTGPDPTNEDPVETTVTSPQPATITINETSGGAVGSGFAILAQQVEITSTATYSNLDPAVIELKIDVSRVPPGEDEMTVQIFRDGSQVGEPCTGGDGVTALSPDPCVFSRAAELDGDLVFTVKTSTLSSWTFGAPLPPVGGIAELPEVAETPLESSGSSWPSAAVMAGIAAAAGLVALGGAAWWARRRNQTEG